MIRIPSTKDLPTVIRGLVADSGVSQRAFAAKVGVTRKQVEKWLTGENLPNGRSLLMIADALGYDVALVEREKAEPQADDVVHLIVDGQAVTSCCGRTLFELPRAGGHRLTTRDAATCLGRDTEGDA